MKKKLILCLSIFVLFHTVHSQEAKAKKPTIMVVPSDNWCIKNGYTQDFDNQGKKMKLPDYRQALQENFELKIVIAKINEMMIDRGFPLKNLETSIKSLENINAENAMYTSKSGSEIAETPIDRLKQVSKADIWIQISWDVNQSGPKRSISFVFEGIDPYTTKVVAGESGSGVPSFTSEMPILLEEAVLSHLDNFNNQLQGHFDDMFANGREVSLRVNVLSNWGSDLDTEFGAKKEELNDIIESWVNLNTVQHRFNTTDATENIMFFEQVRIPLFDEKGKSNDSRNWTKGLQKYLKDNYQIPSKILMKGLGSATLILGEK
jgi:hypothetical protein